MIKYIKIPWWFGFEAFTVYPFIFHVGKMAQAVKRHELVHHDQQKKWFKWYTLWVGGLAAWLFMYFIMLPIGWNYWRYKWEYEAFTKGSGYTKAYAKGIIEKRYYLWWH